MKSLPVFLILLALCSPAYAQVPDRDYQIRGRIVLPDGYLSQQKGIEVRLELTGNQLVQTTFTDEDGRFHFRGLENTTYYIYVNLEGYETVNQQVSMQRQTDVNITIGLRKGVNDTVMGRTRREGDERSRAATIEAVTVDVSVLRKYPQKVINEYDQAVKDSQRGKVDSAVSRLKKLVASTPDFFEARMQLGISLQVLHRYKESEEQFQRARTLKPADAQPVIKLGGLYLEQSRYPEATKMLEEGARMDPHSAEGHYYLGSALFKLNRMSEAETTLQRALEVDKPMANARLILVNIYIKQRRHQEALDQLTAYLTDYPDSPQRQAVEQIQAQLRGALKQR